MICVVYDHHRVPVLLAQSCLRCQGLLVLSVQTVLLENILAFFFIFRNLTTFQATVLHPPVDIGEGHAVQLPHHGEHRDGEGVAGVSEQVGEVGTQQDDGGRTVRVGLVVRTSVTILSPPPSPLCRSPA